MGKYSTQQGIRDLRDQRSEIYEIRDLRDQIRDHKIGLIADRLDSEMLRGFCDRRTDRQTDLCDSRVAFATENQLWKYLAV